MIEKRRRRAVVRLVISSVILCVLVSVLLVGINKGNHFPFFSFHFGSNSYPNADKYTAGNTSIAIDKLEEIDIDWISGSVQLELYEGETIELEETDADKLSEEDRVHSYYENGVLRIQFRESEHFSFHLCNLTKSLHVRIPQKLYSEPDAVLNKLSIDSVSADVTVNGLPMRDFISDSVSGNISLTGAVEECELDSVSGDIQLISTTTPTDIETDTVSGDVTITVPADSQFSIEHDSVSGDLSNAFPTTHNKQKNHWEFDSVSGNVTIGSSK